MNDMKTSEQIGSAGIAAEMNRLKLEKIEFIGSFLPVDAMLNVCDADAQISIYQFPNGALVANTNGDPIWSGDDQQGWNILMAEYGINLK